MYSVGFSRFLCPVKAASWGHLSQHLTVAASNFRCLTIGTSIAPRIFQRKMHEIMSNLDGLQVYTDSVICLWIQQFGTGESAGNKNELILSWAQTNIASDNSSYTFMVCGQKDVQMDLKRVELIADQQAQIKINSGWFSNNMGTVGNLSHTAQENTQAESHYNQTERVHACYHLSE